MSQLTNEDLVALIQEGHAELMQVLITRNLNLVRGIAHRMNIPGVPFEDRVQDGCIGMMEAVATFDSTKGMFSTHATQRIRAKILRDGNEQSHMIRLPANVVEMKMKVTKYIKQRIADTGKRPTAQFVADVLGLDVDEVQHIMAMPGAAPMSLDVSVGDDEDGNVIGAIGDAIGSDVLETTMWTDARASVILDFVDELPEIDQHIVIEVLGLKTGIAKTMRDLDKWIANEAGYSMNYSTINIRYNNAIAYIKERINGGQNVFHRGSFKLPAPKNDNLHDVIVIASSATMTGAVVSSTNYSQETLTGVISKLHCDVMFGDIVRELDSQVLQYDQNVTTNDLRRAIADAEEAVVAMGFTLITYASA